jgi:hypothetical protein
MTTHQKDSAITHFVGDDYAFGWIRCPRPFSGRPDWYAAKWRRGSAILTQILTHPARSKKHAIELAGRWAEMARGAA